MTSYGRQGGAKSLCVVGATSGLGAAIAERFASEGFDLVLAARDPERLHALSNFLRKKTGANVSVHRFDVLDENDHKTFAASLATDLPDVLVMAIGVQLPQREVDQDPDALEFVLHTNFVGPARVIAVAAGLMKARKQGSIIGIGSVSGERGRASNYVYGSAKAALATFLSGLSHRMEPHGVHVMTIKAGYARTRMTEGRRLPHLLTATPVEFAEYVWKGYRHRRRTVYIKPIWRLVSILVRWSPGGLARALFP